MNRTNSLSLRIGPDDLELVLYGATDLLNSTQLSRLRVNQVVYDLMAGQPRFPREVERVIFTLASRCSTDTAAKASRVARHVRQWTEPVLYEHLVFQHATEVYRFLESALSYKDPTFFVKHVKSLFFDHDIGAEDICTVITACPNIDSLCLWSALDTEDEEGSSLGKLPEITRLSTSVSNLSLAFEADPSVVKRLTHLYIIDYLSPQGNEDSLIESNNLFPSLTHLLLNYQGGSFEGEWIDSVLQSFDALQVCVVIFNEMSSYEPEEVQKMETYFRTEPRVVVLSEYDNEFEYFVADWVSSMSGEHDVWAVADEVMKERSRNYIFGPELVGRLNDE